MRHKADGLPREGCGPGIPGPYRVVNLIYFANHFTFCFSYGKILCIVKLTKLSFRCNGAHERELFA